MYSARTIIITMFNVDGFQFIFLMDVYSERKKKNNSSLIFIFCIFVLLPLFGAG